MTQDKDIRFATLEELSIRVQTGLADRKEVDEFFGKSLCEKLLGVHVAGVSATA